LCRTGEKQHLPKILTTLIKTYPGATKATSVEPNEILPLTSVRFIAALMVVMCHVHKYGVFTIAALDDVPLEAGVSFFFVLSGFILTYTYFTRDFAGKNLQRFYASRFARIWPAHFTAGILALIIAPSILMFIKPLKAAGIVFTNLFMLQSWIPRSEYFFSLNSPSWSISTEFFFYLCFPFLLPQIKGNWKRPLLVTLAATLISIAIASSVGARGFSLQGYSLFLWIIYINPVARIFEFVLGMAAAKAFFTFKEKLLELSPRKNTAFELAGLFLIATTFILSFHHCKIITGVMPSAFGSWIRFSGSSPAFALLITALAIGNGRIAKLLSNKVWVHLGKISYSVFLLHTVLFYYYQSQYALIQNLPPLARVGIFLVALLVVADLCFRFVETPCRDILKKFLQDFPNTLRPRRPELALADIHQFSIPSVPSAEPEKV
jgi:peptidoglycan/LPS O-acetylase OafA/YrhL